MDKNESFKVLGIKKVEGKEGRVYVSFFCMTAFTDYEVENSKELSGKKTEVVQADNDFGVVVGDEIEFIYGKAIPTAKGVYQPIKGVNFISRANNK